MAAHFAYLASGGLCGRGKVTLLGVAEEVAAAPAATSTIPTSLGPGSPSQAKGSVPGCVNLRKMSDVRILAALRMTEVFERAVMLCEDGASPSKTASSSISTSLTSMLGLGGVGRKATDSSENAAGEVTRELKLQRLSGDTIMKCRIALCPHKVRMALWLADLGLTEAAYAYAMEAKALAQLVSAGQGEGPAKPVPGKAGKPPVPTKGGGAAEGGGKGAAFSRGFMNTLQEFIDRLSGGNAGGNMESHLHYCAVCT